jgi:hypothetical protein
VGFFVLRFGGGGGGERFIEFRKRRKKEKEREEEEKKERDGAPWRTCLIDRLFPSRLFSFFFLFVIQYFFISLLFRQEVTPCPFRSPLGSLFFLSFMHDL